MRVLLQHRTTYQYDRSIFLTPPSAKAKTSGPLPYRIPIEFYAPAIQTQNHLIHWQQDPFGNFLARIDFKEPMHELLIDVNIIANLTPINPFDFFLDDYAQFSILNMRGN